MVVNSVRQPVGQVVEQGWTEVTVGVTGQSDLGGGMLIVERTMQSGVMQFCKAVSAGQKRN